MRAAGKTQRERRAPCVARNHFSTVDTADKQLPSRRKSGQPLHKFAPARSISSRGRVGDILERETGTGTGSPSLPGSSRCHLMEPPGRLYVGQQQHKPARYTAKIDQHRNTRSDANKELNGVDWPRGSKTPTIWRQWRARLGSKSSSNLTFWDLVQGTSTSSCTYSKCSPLPHTSTMRTRFVSSQVASVANTLYCPSSTAKSQSRW